MGGMLDPTGCGTTATADTGMDVVGGCGTIFGLPYVFRSSSLSLLLSCFRSSLRLFCSLRLSSVGVSVLDLGVVSVVSGEWMRKSLFGILLWDWRRNGQMASSCQCDTPEEFRLSSGIRGSTQRVDLKQLPSLCRVEKLAHVTVIWRFTKSSKYP